MRNYRWISIEDDKNNKRIRKLISVAEIIFIVIFLTTLAFTHLGGGL